MEPVVTAVTAATFTETIKHVRKWLSNLSRATPERKQQSIDALRKVILAVRETRVYIRHLNDTGERERADETHLAFLWTELGFTLRDLNLNTLARRCEIKGKYWSDPTHYDQEFLDMADIKLDSIERSAAELLNGITR
jgi:hypothetical protein